MKRHKPLRRLSPLRTKAASLGLRRSKSPGAYKRRLWAIFSEYIRRKAADSAGIVACVSCATRIHWKEAQAGHYIAKSLGTNIYFDEQNVAVQCVRCNLYMSGNLPSYALYLVKTHGIGILEALDAKRREIRKISEAEYIDLIAEYTDKLKKLEKLPEAA